MIGTLKLLTMHKIEIVYPFDPFIFKSHFEFDWQTLKPICENLIDGVSYKDATQLTYGQTSQYNNLKPHQIKEFAPFYSWLMSCIPNIAKVIVGQQSHDVMEENSSNMDYYVSNSWVNVHNKDGVTSEHNHACTGLVVATYLNMPENSGYFECKDPLEYHKAMLPLANSHLWRQIPTISGDLLVFPGWLKHRTQTNLSNENRWVLTTNLMQKLNNI
jgi:uncharacterized protein (TIGR02466 family)